MGRETKYNYREEFIVNNDYIFYDRLSESAPQSLWNGIKDKALKELNENIKFFDQKSTKNKVGDFLLAQAAAEKKKEINFMERVFEIDITQLDLNDYPTLINKLNKLIGLKDEYKQLLMALNEGVGKTENQRKKGRGFGASQFFDSYLSSNLSNNISSAMRSQKNRNIILSGSEADYNDFITKIIDDSIEDAIKQIANTRTDTIAGVEVSMWKKAEKILDDTEKELYERFKSELYKRYNLDDTKEQIKIFLKNKLSSHSDLKGLSTRIRNSYTMNIKGDKAKELYLRGAEGYIDEFLQVAFTENMVLTDKGTAINRRGTVLQSNVAKTDTVSLYSADINFNLQPLLDEINSAGHFENLVKTQDFLNDFNNKLQSMPDNFVIYESVKKYANQSENFKGFHGGKVNIRNLPLMFEKTKNQIDVDKLIITLLNTMNGAVLTKGRRDRKKMSHALSSSIATFLFDDWESLGDVNNEQALHIFILDSLRVPLSYLLYAVGMAIKQAENNPESFVKFSYNLGKILYPEPIGSEESGIIFDPSDGGMKKYWDEQRQKAFNEANFSATFLQNFNDLIKSLVQKL